MAKHTQSETEREQNAVETERNRMEYDGFWMVFQSHLHTVTMMAAATATAASILKYKHLFKRQYDMIRCFPFTLCSQREHF